MRKEFVDLQSAQRSTNELESQNATLNEQLKQLQLSNQQQSLELDMLRSNTRRDNFAASTAASDDITSQVSQMKQFILFLILLFHFLLVINCSINACSNYQ